MINYFENVCFYGLAPFNNKMENCRKIIDLCKKLENKLSDVVMFSIFYEWMSPRPPLHFMRTSHHIPTTYFPTSHIIFYLFIKWRVPFFFPESNSRHFTYKA
ncbi:hypothetical protein LguiA_027570 [Lonicera macranthoides]